MPRHNHKLFLLFVTPLNKLGTRYMISGSVAGLFYGEPRFTQDVDFVIFLNEREAAQLSHVFDPAQFYVPPAETILAEIRREQRGHFNLIHNESAFKADMYLVGRDDLNAWGFRHKRTLKYEGETVVLAPPKYVVVKKLEYHREGRSEKHLHDIRSMLAVSRAEMDQSALKDWIERRGLQPEWRLVSE